MKRTRLIWIRKKSFLAHCPCWRGQKTVSRGLFNTFAPGIAPKRISSFGVGSWSAHGLFCVSNYSKMKRKVKFATKLIRNCSIFCLQETHGTGLFFVNNLDCFLGISGRLRLLLVRIVMPVGSLRLLGSLLRRTLTKCNATLWLKVEPLEPSFAVPWDNSLFIIGSQ